LVDGLVFAALGLSPLDDYRSVMVLGQAQEITHVDAKRRALDAIVRHPLPGRSKAARPANAKELAATRVLGRHRGGLGEDALGGHRDEAISRSPVWAGSPLGLVAGARCGRSIRAKACRRGPYSRGPKGGDARLVRSWVAASSFAFAGAPPWTDPAKDVDDGVERPRLASTCVIS